MTRVLLHQINSLTAFTLTCSARSHRSVSVLAPHTARWLRYLKRALVDQGLVIASASGGPWCPASSAACCMRTFSCHNENWLCFFVSSLKLEMTAQLKTYSCISETTCTSDLRRSTEAGLLPIDWGNRITQCSVVSGVFAVLNCLRRRAPCAARNDPIIVARGCLAVVGRSRSPCWQTSRLLDPLSGVRTIMVQIVRQAGGAYRTHGR